MPPKDLSKDRLFQEFIGGRNAQEQLDYIRRYGSHGLPASLRSRELWGAGIEKPEGNAENVMYFGCYQLPRFSHSFRRFFALLQRLGVEYTFLDYETCCGDPVAEATVGAEREDAFEAAKGFVQINADEAMRVGGKRLVYFCIWCAYIARRVDPDGPVAHLYYPDVVLDKLRHAELSVSPMTIGYYEGCHRRGKNLAPGITMDFAGYRELLGRIKGLTVVDINSRLCCVDVPGRIVDDAVGQNVDSIVSVCNACHIRLRDEGKHRIRTQFYIDFLCDVLDVPEVRT